MKGFANEPALDLRRADERDALTAALGPLEARLPLEVPVLIGGDRAETNGIASTDPGSPARVVATAGVASARAVDEAVRQAAAAAHDWGARPAAARAEILAGAADRLRDRRHELAALQVRECAKPWLEADRDVCEAIDFIEYYAREAVALERGPELTQVPGERNSMRYVARGVAAVISPWNFPLALPAGMTSAALAAGNAVVLKPAEQSPASALVLVDALHGAGVPVRALSLLPGYAETGAALVRHPGVHVVAFTGSAAVGLEILRAAAETPEEQPHVKGVVAEMGGKNCVVVDYDADLDDAVPAVVGSAFEYAGQKCSAAARVLVHEAIADTLLERLAGAIRALRVGQADVFGTDVPPLIESAARDRVRRYGELARAEGEVVVERDDLPPEGWFAGPMLVAGLAEESAVVRDEIFGPLLTLERVADVREACEVLERSPFALTAGLFSRNPAAVAEMTRRAPAGNLYVNRRITGAMVGRQPFGGNRRSGIGLKAGGPGYLLQFVEPRVVSENTMRHGLPVE